MNGGAQPAASACPCETISFPQGRVQPVSVVGDQLPHRRFRRLSSTAAPRLAERGCADRLAAGSGRRSRGADDRVVAYLADILTFYNERIANEDYLTTAQLPESVNHLVQALRHRPRPALGSPACSLRAC